MCLHHRKKHIRGQIEYVSVTSQFWDTCSRGHRWTADNIHWEKVAGKSTPRRRCRKCLATKAARRRHRDNGEIAVPEPVKPDNAEMAKAIKSFDKAASYGMGLCRDKESEWTDYTWRNAPSIEEAAEMCNGCPMRDICANSALATKPGWGVWGGQAWYLGAPVRTEMRHREMIENEKAYDDD